MLHSRYIQHRFPKRFSDLWVTVSVQLFSDFFSLPLSLSRVHLFAILLFVFIRLRRRNLARPHFTVTFGTKCWISCGWKMVNCAYTWFSSMIDMRDSIQHPKWEWMGREGRRTQPIFTAMSTVNSHRNESRNVQWNHFVCVFVSMSMPTLLFFGRILWVLLIHTSCVSANDLESSFFAIKFHIFCVRLQSFFIHSCHKSIILSARSTVGDKIITAHSLTVYQIAILSQPACCDAIDDAYIRVPRAHTHTHMMWLYFHIFNK